MLLQCSAVLSRDVPGSSYYSSCKKHKNYEFCATKLKSDDTYETWGKCNQKNCPVKGQI